MLNTMNGRFVPGIYSAINTDMKASIHITLVSAIYDLFPSSKVLVGSNLLYALLNGKGRLRESTHSDIMIVVKSCSSIGVVVCCCQHGSYLSYMTYYN